MVTGTAGEVLGEGVLLVFGDGFVEALWSFTKDSVNFGNCVLLLSKFANISSFSFSSCFVVTFSPLPVRALYAEITL